MHPRFFPISGQEKSQSVSYSTDLELDYWVVLRKLCVNTHCIKLNDMISTYPQTFIMHTFSDPNCLFIYLMCMYI